MAGETGDAVEERPRAEPAAVEVIAAEDVAEVPQELPEAAAAFGIVREDHEELPGAAREEKRADLVIVPAVPLVAAECLSPGGRIGKQGQKLPAGGARGLRPDEGVPAIQGPFEPGRVRVLEFPDGGSEPGVEKSLGQEETGDPQLLGDIDLVLGDGLRHVGLADEIEAAVLRPLIINVVPVVRVAVELAGRRDRYERGRDGGRALESVKILGPALRRDSEKEAQGPDKACGKTFDLSAHLVPPPSGSQLEETSPIILIEPRGRKPDLTPGR